MDLEELSFRLGIILLIVCILGIALIYFNMLSYALDFAVFVFTVVCLISSVVCLAVNFIYTWQTEEPYPYYAMQQQQLEHSQKHTVIRSPHHRKAKTVNVDPPTKKQLVRLKEVLGIEKGSLQYKKRGQSVYLVTYKDEKHHWKHVGLWIELKEKLGEKSPQINLLS